MNTNLKKLFEAVSYTCNYDQQQVEHLERIFRSMNCFSEHARFNNPTVSEKMDEELMQDIRKEFEAVLETRQCKHRACAICLGTGVTDSGLCVHDIVCHCPYCSSSLGKE